MAAWWPIRRNSPAAAAGWTTPLRAYHRLNRLAVEGACAGRNPGDVQLLGHVTREDFLYMLVGVAQQSKRDIQILEMRSAAPDHPPAPPAWKPNT